MFVVGSSYETLSFGVLRKSQDAVDRNGWVLFNAEKKLTWMLRGPESFPFIWRGAAPWTRFGWQSWWSCCRQWLILRQRPSWDARRVFEDRSSPQERRLTVYLFLFLFSKTKTITTAKKTAYFKGTLIKRGVNNLRQYIENAEFMKRVSIK